MEKERPEFYVYSDVRTIDDKGRLTLPAEFEIPVGGLIYFESRFRGVKCYDEVGFSRIAESMSSRRFRDFKHNRTDSSGRLSLNGYFAYGEEVIVIGKEDHFVVLRDETLIDSLRRKFKRKK